MRILSTIRFLALLFLVAGLAESAAFAQSVELGVKTRQIYSDVPFLLQVTVSGFEDSPEPVIEDWQLEGAKVQFQGMSPRVMSRRTVINGQLTQSREVTYVYNYRIEPTRAGRFQIPALQATQGTTVASSRPSGFEASDVSESRDMRISMQVPDRAVWLGESFEVDIDLFLRASPKDLNFVIPLFEHPAFEAEAPDAAGADVLGVLAGGKELKLPYQTSEVVDKGAKATRFQFKALVTPTKSGRFQLEAPRVVAQLKTGNGRDAFGFRQARYTRFKSTGVPVLVEVKALPASGRPASFSNAVGANFSIQVEASRSVVSLGEPIELTVALGGERGLEGLSLPPLVGAGGLNPNYFDLAGNAGTGEMSEDGLRKVFKVSVVLTSAEAREIPSLEFAYFDPEVGSYRVARSQPIALNVNGSAVVGAKDVVGTRRKKQDGQKTGNGAVFAGDLSPSQGDTTLRTMLGLSAITPLLVGFYAFPLLLLAIALWMRRTGDSRGRNSDLRSGLASVEKAAENAKKMSAEESVGEFVSSIRDLGRMTGNRPGDWLSELESLAFDPKRKSRPADSELVDSALSAAKNWYKSAKAGKADKRTGVSLLLLVGLSCLSSSVEAAEPVETNLDTIRRDYGQALASEERGERTRRFGELARQFAQLAEEYPGRPELLADWGNAALGAGDFGTAVLAYRRALFLDRGLVRAKQNLDWIRSQLPTHLVANTDDGAVDSLFFWHKDWPVATRHLTAAIAFMVFILLLLPWGKVQMLRRRLAIAPALLFVATLSSALLEPDRSDSAVVVTDSQTLRSADSTGAPATLKAPLPAGLEVLVQQTRGNWTQITLADGTTGWLSGESTVLISP